MRKEGAKIKKKPTVFAGDSFSARKFKKKKMTALFFKLKKFLNITSGKVKPTGFANPREKIKKWREFFFFWGGGEGGGKFLALCVCDRGMCKNKNTIEI